MESIKPLEGTNEKKTASSRRGYLITKRLFDIVMSLLALIVLSPVFLVTAIAIYLDDKGPVIFSQDRNGINGEVCRMYKFRSMCVNAPELHKELLKMNELDGPAFKMQNDPRVTKVGRFIRKTSIDELPQLINILKGEMSIVGPRPLPTYETEQCTDYQKQRLLAKPGLTCYWQCSGRNDIPFDEWMELDLMYIEEASFWVDLKIVFMTVVAVVTGKGACQEEVEIAILVCRGAGAGHIGSHINKLLHKESYETVVFDNLIYRHREAVKREYFVQGDLKSIEVIEKVFQTYKIDAVFHFAAYAYVCESVSEPEKYYYNNVANTLKLLQVTRKYGCNKISFSSTCATKGETEQVPITEDMPHNPINPYGATKLMIENF